MELKININMDDDALEVSPEAGCYQILLDIGTAILKGKTFGKCMDVNGNSVGQWEIEV